MSITSRHRKRTQFIVEREFAILTLLFGADTANALGRFYEEIRFGVRFHNCHSGIFRLLSQLLGKVIMLCGFPGTSECCRNIRGLGAIVDDVSLQDHCSGLVLSYPPGCQGMVSLEKRAQRAYPHTMFFNIVHTIEGPLISVQYQNNFKHLNGWEFGTFIAILQRWITGGKRLSGAIATHITLTEMACI